MNEQFYPKTDERPGDAELISNAKEKGQAFRDSTVMYAEAAIAENAKILRNFIDCPELYDIGGGKMGGGDVSITRLGAGIEHITLIEPYASDEDVFRSEWGDIRDTLTFERADGLSFLLKESTKPGNVMMCSLDASVVGSVEYLVRLTEEVYRIVPENGVFICVNSPEIEKMARKLFPFVMEKGLILFFSKKDILGNLVEQLVSGYEDILREIEGIMTTDEYKKFEAGTEGMGPFEKRRSSPNKYGGLDELKMWIHELINSVKKYDNKTDSTIASFKHMFNMYTGADSFDFKRFSENEKIRNIWVKSKKLIFELF